MVEIRIVRTIVSSTIGTSAPKHIDYKYWDIEQEPDMTTEFTREWLKKPRNQSIIRKAQELSQIKDTGDKNFHLFFLFKKIESLDIVWSQEDLIEQGWTKGTIKKYLSCDIIFSFTGTDVYLAEAVKEAVFAMPDGAAKAKIFMRKLCR